MWVFLLLLLLLLLLPLGHQVRWCVLGCRL
jgi:hypothetical protein